MLSLQADYASRVAAFLADCAQAGIAWRRAAIVAAIAKPETDGQFVQQNSSSLVLPDCVPFRPTLALERGGTRLGGKLPQEVTSDAQLMAYLRQVNALTPAGDQINDVFSAFDSMLTPNNALADVFWWCLDNRDINGIALMSIGPTQLYMKLSPLASTPGVPGRFTTFEQLYVFSTAETVQQLFDPAGDGSIDPFGYLTTTDDSYPIPGQPLCGAAGDPGCLETYLVKQVGLQDFSQQRWQQYAEAVAAAVDIVWAAGRDLNYPSIG